LFCNGLQGLAILDTGKLQASTSVNIFFTPQLP
jgi:hypothetical protein